MKTITTEKIPIKLWLSDIESKALEQAKNLANHPFAFHHIAIMPDSHEGYGMPIGGVLAAKDVVIPNAVGVDIGCGMCAVKTSLTEIEKDNLKDILGDIKKNIPLGFDHHKHKQDERLMPDEKIFPIINGSVIEKEYNSACTQIGTLGGGNHFIEIQKDKDGIIWIMIHSGSRNLGKKVADYYNKLAIKLKDKFHNKVPDKWELAYLPLDSKEGDLYFNEMNYCIEFALANRKLMMERVIEVFENNLSGFKSGELINIAHNYAKMEKHFHSNVMVHRKGATMAFENTIGIIPGSQGAKSYIVKGKGNPESFYSCSHGAGRKMSRNMAIKNLNLNEEIKRLNSQGIIHGIRNRNDLDEAAGAYKNIETVMNEQKDLVDILVELSPLAVIKG